jgi:DNA-binding GntR family transcriptional regulator
MQSYTVYIILNNQIILTKEEVPFISLTRIDKPIPLYKQVFNTVVNEIMVGNLMMGTKLFEVSLSEQLGVSRTPIREALRALEAEGWVEGTEGSGYAVFAPTIQEFIELSDCRAALEGLAARKMAENGSEQEIEELRLILVKTKAILDEQNRNEVLQVNHQFHQHIIDSSHNNHLRKLLNPLKSRIYLYRLILHQCDRLHLFYPEHYRIYEAIHKRDGASAERELLQHLANDREYIENHLIQSS